MSNVCRLVQQIVLVCVGDVFVVLFGGALLVVVRATVVWCLNVCCVGTGIFVDCFLCSWFCGNVLLMFLGGKLGTWEHGGIQGHSCKNIRGRCENGWQSNNPGAFNSFSITGKVYPF